MVQFVCNGISYSTIANGHGIVTKPADHPGDSAFNWIYSGTATYPVMSSGGYDNFARPCSLDAFQWYATGRVGTLRSFDSRFSQRPALDKTLVV